MNYYWINQPSTLQHDHKWHGMTVLCDLSSPENKINMFVRVFFIDKSNKISMMINKNALSKGINHNYENKRWYIKTCLK